MFESDFQCFGGLNAGKVLVSHGKPKSKYGFITSISFKSWSYSLVEAFDDRNFPEIKSSTSGQLHTPSKTGPGAAPSSFVGRSVKNFKASSVPSQKSMRLVFSWKCWTTFKDMYFGSCVNLPRKTLKKLCLLPINFLLISSANPLNFLWLHTEAQFCITTFSCYKLKITRGWACLFSLC